MSEQRIEYRVVNGKGLLLRLLPDKTLAEAQRIAAEYLPDVQARVEHRVVTVGPWVARDDS